MSDNGRSINRVPPPGVKWATKDDVVAGIAAGSLAMGQKVYDQCMEQTARMLGEMEARLVAVINEQRPYASWNGHPISEEDWRRLVALQPTKTAMDFNFPEDGKAREVFGPYDTQVSTDSEGAE